MTACGTCIVWIERGTAIVGQRMKGREWGEGGAGGKEETTTVCFDDVSSYLSFPHSTVNSIISLS